MRDARASADAPHLATLAREPRPAGGAGEARAREYASAALRSAGFTVRVEPFEYSAFPGRLATPIGGALATATVCGVAWAGLHSVPPTITLGALAAALAIGALFTRSMLGDAVLDCPLLRATSSNVVATRGTAVPRVWLMAHLDSKSQPVPSALRVAGTIGLAASVVLAACTLAMQLGGWPHRMGWWGSAVLAILCGVPVMASVVGAQSIGAVDNASGVATVLLAATRLRADLSVGVLLPSAEELGLAGARAWAREWATRHEAGVVLNVDGVDDHGELTIMYSGSRPVELLRVLERAAEPAPRIRRMPPGLLTDSVALADRGWQSVTVSRGSLATLRRVHTRADSLESLRGTGVDPAATLLVRAAEALV